MLYKKYRSLEVKLRFFYANCKPPLQAKYSIGVKYAAYLAGDEAFVKVDLLITVFICLSILQEKQLII